MLVTFHEKYWELLRDVRYVLSVERFEGTHQVYRNTHGSHGQQTVFVMPFVFTNAFGFLILNHSASI